MVISAISIPRACDFKQRRVRAQLRANCAFPETVEPVAISPAHEIKIVLRERGLEWAICDRARVPGALATLFEGNRTLVNSSYGRTQHEHTVPRQQGEFSVAEF